MSLLKEHEMGEDARRVIESDAWKDAWLAYRTRILEEIEAAPSNKPEFVMHLKNLLAAATAAKGHLELIMNMGSAATKMINLEEQRARKLSDLWRRAS